MGVGGWYLTGTVTVCMNGWQENEAKRNRAEKRAADELKARKQKEKEIVDLEDKLETLRSSSVKIEALVSKST